jgi:hypothetical protein
MTSCHPVYGAAVLSYAWHGRNRRMCITYTIRALEYLAEFLGFSMNLRNMYMFKWWWMMINDIIATSYLCIDVCACGQISPVSVCLSNSVCLVYGTRCYPAFLNTHEVSSTQFFRRFQAYWPHLQNHNEPATKCGITTGTGISVRYRDDSRYQMVPGLSPPYSPYVMTWFTLW